MKKSKFIILFIIFALLLMLVCLMVKAQSEITAHINTRNAKENTTFDYYFGTGFKTTIKFVTINLKNSYERYNGVTYLAHSEKASCKYGQLGYDYDTEKNIDLFYASTYYSFKLFKAGYDFSVDQNIKHSIYLNFKWKFIDAEIAFLDHVRRLKYLIDPIIKKWDKVSLKAKVEGFYVPGKFKWQNGLSINYKIKKP